MPVLNRLKSLLKTEASVSKHRLRRQLTEALQQAHDAREHKWNMEASEYPRLGPSPELQDASFALQRAEARVRHLAQQLHMLTTEALSM